MLIEYNHANQQQILEQIGCSVLLIHGDSADDEEELMLLERSRRALKHLPPGSRLEVIAGAKHGFHGEIDQVVRLATDWYRERF